MLVTGLFASIFFVSYTAFGKWTEGHIDTKEKWAFLERFCFLSYEGQFEYLIEFDKDMGVPNLLLYYDDESQWPSVYHSEKTCKEREKVLNKVGQNQIIKLSHWYPDTEFSGCIIKKEDKEMPSAMSTTSEPPKTTSGPKTTINKNNSNETQHPADPKYYHKFLKTTTAKPKSTITDANNTTWYEVLPTFEYENSTVNFPDDDLWESIGDHNGTHFENLNDVEVMFSGENLGNGHKIKRSTFEIYEKYRRRRLNSDSQAYNANRQTERYIVSCHNSRRFRSARERWWFIAISNCDGNKGLDVRYRFLMTNGPDGDFWHQHFSADEFYVLPVLLAYTFAYVLVMVAVVMCSVELKSRHLLHSTYKLFLFSIVVQHFGITIQSLGYIKYAVNGFGGYGARVTGQFMCGLSEMSFLLLLVLLAKGYTITRGRLKVGFTVKLTVFMCLYCVTYVILFVYQAKAFDPGEVLYLYESPAGYGLIVLRIVGWAMFALATFCTVKKYPEKNLFYGPFSICGTLWFYAGPLFILTANSYIDKWVRESVVTAVLLFIAFCGHIMFLLLTLPVFANKNFPYHVRTTQIGVMEVTGNGLDNFGSNPYCPTQGPAQTVIIPLTRRTEELIGNIYSQYMASPENGVNINETKSGSLVQNKLVQQESVETNNSEDIQPSISKEVFTIQNEMKNINASDVPKLDRNGSANENTRSNDLPIGSRDMPLLRSRRTLLEPLKLDQDKVPSWSLAKGPAVALALKKTEDEIPPVLNLTDQKKVPSVRNGLPSSGDISTITEGYEQNFANNTVSKATMDLFSVANK